MEKQNEPQKGGSSGDGPPCLRIFLSYGHDKNEELVMLIKSDLEKRGHDVWIDRDKIEFGDDWRRSITAGILEDRSVLAFLSKHSMRDPGVCRDEIAIALSVKGGNIQTVLVESEAEVTPPANISHIQWLDMHDWDERRKKSGWDEWYQAKFNEIVRVVESGKSQHFAGEIEDLKRILKPIASEARVNNLLRKGIFGRTWLFEAVEKWRSDPARRGQRVFWITGAPGIGKSAFAAQLSYVCPDRVVAAQFVEWDKQDHRDAGRVIRSLAFQLAARLPDYRKLLLTLPELNELGGKEPAELFDYLLANPLSVAIDGGRDRLVIVIDALDEAGDAQKNPFVEMLAKHAPRLPDWLGIVATSRPDSAVKAPLQGLNPYVFEAQSEANLEDLRGYLLAQKDLGLAGRPDAGQLIGQILERSEGVFLYIELFCEEIRNKSLSLDHPEQFPSGLGGIYNQWFRRQFPDEAKYEAEVLPALRPILAAREPLSAETLRHVSGWGLERYKRFTRMTGSLFPVSETNQTIKPSHKSLIDWLTDEGSDHNYFVDVGEGHRALAKEGLRQFAEAPETMDEYFLRWLPSHLLTLKENAQTVELLKDYRYMMERAKRGALEQMLADYRELPAGLGVQLDIEAAFFRERTHMLRRGSDEWPAHKILLQLAMEHADDSPVTRGAERWLGEGRCDWLWLRRVPRLPNVQKNPCIAVLEGHTGSVSGALELRDGRILSWAEDNTLRLWDVQTLQSLAVLEGHTDSVKGALELRNGRILSWASRNYPDFDETLRVWERQTGKPLAKLEGHTNCIEGALELRDGWILSWSYDYTLRLWDEQAGQPLATLQGHTNRVDGALELRDRRILSWAWDSTLRVWNGQTGQTLATLQGHTGPVYGALEICDGKILSWSADKTLRLWDGRTGQTFATLYGHTARVDGALELRNERILSWSYDKTLRIWNGQTGEPLAVLNGHINPIIGAFELRDGRILSWSKNRTLRIWNEQTGKLFAMLDGHINSINGALELCDGRILSWAWDDKTLRLWNGQTGQPLATLESHTSYINGALKLRNRRILSWSQDRTLRVWNEQTGQSLAVLEGHTDSVKGALELRDGRILSWAHDYTLRLWNEQTGQFFAILEGHTYLVAGALELLDGRILSWAWDSTLRVWDGQTGQSLAVFEGHTNWVNGALELRDGRILSWSKDNNLRLWDRKTEECLEIVPEEQVSKLHPEWVREREKAEKTQSVIGDFLGTSSNRNAQLRYKDISPDLAVWQAESEAETRCLMPDGTLVVTQANGQVCILKLYQGNRRVSLDDIDVI